MSTTRETHQSDGSVTEYQERLAGKYLTFYLGNEEYAVEILKVQEIIQMHAVTKVPKVPNYIRGVINLRGKVIPIVELRKKFGMDPIEDTDKTAIVVMMIEKEGETITMGIIIDNVREVADLEAEQIEHAPDFGAASVDSDFIMGICKSENNVKIMLDIDKILTNGELSALTTIQA